jgi:multiple sugar transport system ATP-binding protein
MRIEIGKLHSDLKSTMIYVTHDQVEAMTMADKIVVLHGGIVEQVGSPLELYHRPRNMFVAGFIGSPKMNFVPATVQAVKGKTVTVSLPGNSTLAIPVSGALPAVGEALTLGCRPEHVAIAGGRKTALRGRVRAAEYLGSETMFYLTLEDGSEFAVKGDGLAAEKVGDILPLDLPVAACHLFDASTSAIKNGDLTR